MGGIKDLVGMDAHIVINAMPGSIGLEPTIEALKNHKLLALANKESMVMAGRLVRKMLGQGNGAIIPVDSEHSALYQIMKTSGQDDLKRLIITASGGPFRNYKKEKLKTVQPRDALNHPTWKMGNKITLDSATLMNKGLEVIEARWLFDIDPSHIDVLIHPESIIHGMVEYIDNSFIAYLAYPDMRIPISYALNEEKRRPLPFAAINTNEMFKLTFYPPDTDRFPSLKIALEALADGDSSVIVMNAANEVAARAFIDGKIRFTEIPVLIEKTLEQHHGSAVVEDIQAILEIHQWAEQVTEEKIQKEYE
jgi:1-deoxy-D-xylulose-5-phosphate reductoisomerase